MSVLTTQHASMPVAAMNPNCRNARNSVDRRDEYEAAEASAATAVGCQVLRTVERSAAGTGVPRRRSSKYRDW